MPRYAYVNGRYVPHQDAAIHIEDRGYQFADGVYEVVPVYKGKLIDEEPHLDRLDYSLQELSIAWPVSRPALKLISRELIRRNRVSNGMLYLQITRGVAPRDHKFPKNVRPALVLTTKAAPPLSDSTVSRGVAVASMPDIRWKRRDIKSVSLLPNILGKQKATEEGAFEGWMIDDEGFVTEGTSTNAWIVSAEGKLVTRPANHMILNGITRLAVLSLLDEMNIQLEERPFTLDEALKAREAFLTSSTSFVLPIVTIDGQSVGDGKPGPVTLRLREAYIEAVSEPSAA